MKNSVSAAVILMLLFACSCEKENDSQVDFIIDHSCTDINSIPDSWIDAARKDLHIAYGHTSHGSQLTDGMSGLVTFKGDKFSWGNNPSGTVLDLHDYAMTGDLGNPDRTSWADRTRAYLQQNTDVNVIMWAWCGQVSYATEADINTYLNLMNGLEEDFPGVRFVYMTGHLDGTGLTGNLHIRNEQIRKYCRENNKVLFDFADIESYDPDGSYFGNKKADDGCRYDNNGDGNADSNWATQWQDCHVQGVDWYYCGAAHTEPVNANMKAFAAWWMWARLAGWSGK
jgi:hypothetical protein